MITAMKWACLTTAVAAAAVYVLMGAGVMHPGNLDDGGMPAFYYVIPAGYVLMGAAVFFNRRWLLITDAALVAFTLLVFYGKYADQPDVMWSAPGVLTKVFQVLMLAGLVYLLVKFRKIPAVPAK